MISTPEAQPQEVELLPCPLAHEVVNGLNISSSSGMRKWHLTCLDCGLVFEGRLDETARELFARWNSRAADLPRATADGLIVDLQRELAFHFGAYHDRLGHNLDAAHCRENSCEYIKKLLRTTPRATGETVEACLAELREMWPDCSHSIYIHHFKGMVDYSINIGGGTNIARGRTLADCMAQVRAAATSAKLKHLERLNNDDVPYARVHPVDEARVEEAIREIASEVVSTYGIAEMERDNIRRVVTSQIAPLFPPASEARVTEAWRIVTETAKHACYSVETDPIGSPDRCPKSNDWCLSCRAKDLVEFTPRFSHSPCPVCKGAGSLPSPAHREISNQVAARLLRDAGYSIRQIMTFLGYKSPRSVAILLEGKE